MDKWKKKNTEDAYKEGLYTQFFEAEAYIYLLEKLTIKLYNSGLKRPDYKCFFVLFYLL